MSQFWSPLVSMLSPYIPGEQPNQTNAIKLNTNENPFGPSPKALAAMQAVLNDDLRLYPDPEASSLKHVIASYHQLRTDEVFVGNGSDEVLGLSFLAFFKRDSPLLFPDITYSFYAVYCKLFGIPYQLIPLDDEFRIDTASYRIPSGGIILANPNAPTGVALASSSIEALLVEHPNKVIIIDEAYVDFGTESAVPLIRRYQNLLVVQTLSKSRGLAGLRVGFAMGSPELIDGLNRVKNSFNSYPLDRLSIAGAIASFEDDQHFHRVRNTILRRRLELESGLSSIGFEVLPSSANFVFARHPNYRALELAARLRLRAIFVRHFNQPRIQDYLRITVGRAAENSALIYALAEITGQKVPAYV